MTQHLANFLDALGGLSEAWAAGMWHACWQGGLAIALAWALCRALGERLPARLRPWPWRLALLKMLLCLLAPAPLALRVLPPPRQEASHARSQSNTPSADLDEPRGSSPGPRDFAAASGAAPSEPSERLDLAQASTGARAGGTGGASISHLPNDAPAPNGSLEASDSMASRRAGAAGAGAAVEGAAVEVDSPGASSSSASSAPEQVLAARAVAEPSRSAALWPSALLLAWLGGVGWSLARLAGEGARAERWRRECEPVLDESAQGVLGEMCARLEVRGAPLLLRSGRGGPLLLGLLRPAIVLPATMLEERARGEMKLALAHEAAHLKRHDLAWNVLLSLAGALFWFHPALWLARREWRLGVEQACDELALHATRMLPASYGALLLQVAARRPASVASWGAVGVAQDYALLHRRIAALAGAGRSSKRAVRLGAALLGASTVGLVPWQIAAREAIAEAIAEAPASTSARVVAADEVVDSVASVQEVALVGKFERGAPVLSLAFSPDGKQLASAGSRTEVELWRVSQSGLEKEKTLALPPPPHAVSQIAFGGSGQVLVAASDKARLWDVGAGQVRASLQVADPTPGQRRAYGPGFAVAAAVSPDGNLVASTGQFLIVHARQTDGSWKKVLQQKFYYGIGVAFTPDGRSLVEGGHNGRLLFWSASQLRAGRRVITGGTGLIGNSRLYIGAPGNRVDAAQEPDAFNASMSGLTLSPDGVWLGTSHHAWVKRIYDKPTPGRHNYPMRNGVLFEDGKPHKFKSKRIPSSIVLREGRSGQFSRVLTSPSDINALAFSPDGHVVAGGCDDGVRFWETSTGRLLKTLSEIRQVRALSFSPDGRWLATGGGDRSVRLWRLGAASTSTPATMRASAQMSPALAPTNEKVEVTVLSPSGQPVSGARVFWAQLEEDQQQRTQAFTTDARGRFLFPIGRVRRSPDWIHRAALWAVAPGFGATRYDITPPREAGPEVIRLRPASTLRLSLRDSRGRPLPGIHVEPYILLGQDEPMPVGYRGIFGALTPIELMERFHARTDARGQAVIAGLPQGARVELALRYASPGDNSARGKYLRARPSRFAPLGNESSVLMSAGTVRHTITMLAPATVWGRVTFEDGSPVVRAVIEPKRPAGEPEPVFSSNLPKAHTNAQGRYLLSGLRPGTYEIKVSRGKSLQREWAVSNARVTLREGGNRVDLKLTRGAIIRGRVLSERTGRPVAGQPLGFRDAAQNYEYKVSGPDGAFEFRSVGGEQKLWLRDDQDSAPGFALPLEREFALKVANGQSKSITFRLPSASTPRAIRGQVLAEDGSPAAGAAVSVETIGGTQNNGRRAILKADAQGRFVVPARVTARPVRLWAKAGSRMSSSGTIAVGGDEVVLRIGANNEAEISGRVLDARSKKPLAGVRVSLMESGERVGGGIAKTMSDASGRFRFPDLRPGSVYSLSAEARDYAHGNGEPTPPRAGQSVQADILMRRRDSFVAGRALYSNGKPAVGVRISNMGSAPPVVSDAQGRFRLTNVAEGNVFVYVEPPGSREPSYQHLVAGRSDGRITIWLGNTLAQAKAEKEASLAFWKRRREMIGALAPEIRARGWANSPALSPSSLRGQVVLLDFWNSEYGRPGVVRPEVEEIARAFGPRGLRVIGVHHAPEYGLALQRDFGRQVDSAQPPLDVAGLEAMSRELGLSYALALDDVPAPPARGARGYDATPSGPTATAFNDAPRVVIDRAGRIAYAGDSLGEAMRVVGEMLGVSR